MRNHEVKFEDLLGKELVSISVRTSVRGKQDAILFVTKQGNNYLMYHEHDCCENVDIESIVGDINDLLGYPILLAEEVIKDGSEEPKPRDENGYSYDDSSTWTFYKLATIKGYVDIRWFGESNGYYSETVDFIEITADQDKSVDKQIRELIG